MTRRFQRICIFTPNLGERIKFDSDIFEMGGSTTSQMIFDATYIP